MKTTRNTIGATIKKELSAAFPGIKFSVKYKSFSGGDSVDVSWAFGPATKEVDALLTKYEAGRFDGMTDSYTYAAEDKADQTAKYVHSRREISDEFKLSVAAAYCEKFGVEMLPNAWYNTFVNNEWLSVHVNRIMHKVSFKTSNPEFKSLELLNDWVVLFTETINGETVLPKIKFQLRPAMPQMRIA